MVRKIIYIEADSVGYCQGAIEGLNGIRATMGRKLRYNVDDLNEASCVTRCSRERVRDHQLLLLYCFSDILLMQQSWGHSKSLSKNVLSWAHFADASGGEGT